MEWIVDKLTGRSKNFDVLDREIDSALEQHAEEGMSHYYGRTGQEIQTNWNRIQEEIRNGPGLLSTDKRSADFEQGLGALTMIAEGFKTGKMYEVDGSTYTVFYLEPTGETEVVSENEDTKFLGADYVIGETYQFPDLETGKSNYTRAEKREADADLEETLERPSEKFY